MIRHLLLRHLKLTELAGEHVGILHGDSAGFHMVREDAGRKLLEA